MSEQVENMMQLRTELLKIVRCLNESQIDYALCGGLAVAVHGYPRATKDIDVLIRKEALGDASSALAPLGYDLEAGMFKFDQGTEKETQLFRVSRAEGAMLTTLDLMLVTPVLEGVWDDREVVRAYETDIRVVSKAALIRMKKLAGRHQDLADVESLQRIADEQGE
ncbi:MAG: nucleotidyltransferase family protein [Pirellulaceae bacterium]